MRTTPNSVKEPRQHAADITTVAEGGRGFPSFCAPERCDLEQQTPVQSITSQSPVRTPSRQLTCLDCTPSVRHDLRVSRPTAVGSERPLELGVEAGSFVVRICGRLIVGLSPSEAPRSKLRGFWLFIPKLKLNVPRLVLVPDISPYYVRSHCVAYRSNKITVFPKLTAPQLLP